MGSFIDSRCKVITFFIFFIMNVDFFSIISILLSVISHLTQNITVPSKA